jgi:hypothetical protein
VDGPARSLEEHLAAAPLSHRQWLVWLLATAGKLFEGLIVFMGGIALPLQAVQFSMTPLEHGCVVAASLLGILIGALSLGGLADRFGRRTLFIAEMLVLLLGLPSPGAGVWSRWAGISRLEPPRRLRPDGWGSAVQEPEGHLPTVDRSSAASAATGHGRALPLP